MPSIGSYTVDFLASVAGFTQPIKQAQSSIDELHAKTEQFSREMGSLGLQLTAGLTAPIGAIAAIGISFNSLQQQAQNAFTTMLGDGEKAKSFLNDLKDFAAQTPFEFQDLTRASQRLLAMGFEASKVIPTLTAIGDAVAAMGGGAEMVNRVTTAFGQMQAKGKASAEEMLQLTEAGIPAWEFLANKIGVDIPAAMKMVSDRAVDSSVAIEALTEGINSKFGGMMAEQSKTFMGVISTIKDTLTFIAADALSPLFEMISNGLRKIADILPTLQAYWESLGPEVQNAVVAFGAVLALAGPVALGIAGISAAIAFLATPFGIATVAVGAFVAAMMAFPSFRAVVLDVIDRIAMALGFMASYLKSVGVAVLDLVMGKPGEAIKTMATSYERAMETAADASAGLQKGLSALGSVVSDVTHTSVKHGEEVKAKQIPPIKDTTAEVKKQKEAWDDLQKSLKNIPIGGYTSDWERIEAKLAGTKTNVEQVRDALIGIPPAINVGIVGFEGIDFAAASATGSIADLAVEIDTLKTKPPAVAVQFGPSDAEIAADKSRIQDALRNLTTATDQFFDDVFTAASGGFDSLKSALKGGALSLGKAVVDDFKDAFVGPLKQAFNDFFSGLIESTGVKTLISGLSSKLSGALGIGGIVGGAGAGAGGATAAGGAGAGGGVLGSTSLAKLGAFFTNPVTIGVGAAAAAAIGWLKSQAHWEADTFVREIQDPFARALGDIADANAALLQSGEQTVDGARDAKRAIESLWDAFSESAREFARGGKDEATVVSQAFSQLTPIINRLLSDVSGNIATLTANAEALKDVVDDIGDSTQEVAKATSAVATAAAPLGDIRSAFSNPAGAYAPTTPDDIKRLFTDFGASLASDPHILFSGYPHYAMGTDFVPTTGPAIVHRGERIIPAGQSGGWTLNISIKNAYGDMKELAKQIMQEINTQVRFGDQRLYASKMR